MQAKKSVSTYFEFSKIGFFHNILILIFLQVAAALKCQVWFNALRYSHSSDIVLAVDTSLRILGFFTMIVIILHWVVRQKTAISFMNKLAEIERLFSSLECQIFFDDKKIASFLTQVLFNLFLWVPINVIDLLSFIDSFLDWVVLLLPFIIINFFTIQYFILVKFLSNDLERVNVILRRIENLPKYLSREKIVNDYVTVLSQSSENRLIVVQLVREIRSMICDVSEEITDFFSTPILLAIGCAFCVLLCNLFALIFDVLSHVDGDQLAIDEFVNFVSWILVILYPLSLLSFTVTKIASEVKHTRRIIHKLWAAETNRRIRTELEQFFLQLLHDNFDFNACGFFKLDCTMLHSILGASVTYLVILIQFQQQNNKRNNDNGHGDVENDPSEIQNFSRIPTSM